MDEVDFYIPDEDFSHETTFVFWNLDDYPVPDIADLASLRRKIVSAVYRIGLPGTKIIKVYARDPPKHVIDAFRKAAGFSYFRESDLIDGGYFPKCSEEYSRTMDSPEYRDASAGFKMPLDMICCVGTCARPNLVVIGKQNPESEWQRVLQCLHSRLLRPVYLVDLPDCTGFDSPQRADRLLGVGKRRSKVEEHIKEASKFQDFFKRITPPAKTAVFWDAEDCPNPLFVSNPDEVYRKIEKALRERGHVGEISIWAYVDEKNGSWTDECLWNKTWDSRIYFLPGGDKKSRRNRMLNDILLWIMDSHLYRIHTAKLMVFSNQFRDNTYFFNRLELLGQGNGGVFLVTPTQDIPPDSPEWPGLLIDNADVFGSETETPEQDVAEKAQVFWNLDDYPIPDGARLLSICGMIEDVLDQMGFHGGTDFWLYGGHVKSKELREAEITHYLPKSAFKMPQDMILGAAQKAQNAQKGSRMQSRNQTNFLLIAKQSQKRRELQRVLKCLKSRNYTALVVKPRDDTAQERLFRSVESVYDCTQALGGGKPITKHPRRLYGDASPQLSRTLCEDLSKIQDFSKRITPVKKGLQLGVFWDVVDCPFPPHCSNPDEIYRRIVEAFRGERGGEVSIWAYVDEKNGSSWSGECLRNKTWDSSIYFLPGGDKASRHNRMLNDILLWKMDFPVEYPYKADVMVVSDQGREDSLGNLNSRGDGGVFLATPTRDNNKPESPDWPGPLIEEAHFLPYSSQSSSSEPCPKTPELASVRSRGCARFA